MMIEAGHLQRRIAAQSRDALASGALQPIRTTAEVIVDGGVEFIIREVSSLRRKPAGGGPADHRDPFAPPYEPDLLIGDVSDTHVALLNKFNVLAHHLLIVTRAHQDQECLLDRDDFAALLACLAEIDGLGFYNGGRDAGASQPHKHLQFVPLPLAPVGPAVPLAPLLERTHATAGGAGELPFVHAAAPTHPAWWQSPPRGAAAALDAYHTLLAAAGLHSTGRHQSAPYNLLMSRRWMWLVPRTRGHANGIPVNALGFAGALLARDQDDMAALKRLGPMRVLTATACRPHNPEDRP